jgi:hypothetical protein
LQRLLAYGLTKTVELTHEFFPYNSLSCSSKQTNAHCSQGRPLMPGRSAEVNDGRWHSVASEKVVAAE